MSDPVLTTERFAVGYSCLVHWPQDDGTLGTITSWHSWTLRGARWKARRLARARKRSQTSQRSEVIRG